MPTCTGATTRQIASGRAPCTDALRAAARPWPLRDHRPVGDLTVRRLGGYYRTRRPQLAVPKH
eukprot:4380489-Lingulodinium_polyedra.AAC.1